MFEVTFHPEASQEYEDAVWWYHERRPKAAERFRKAVQRRLDEIAQSPQRWSRLDEDHHFALVERFPYFIVYVPRENDVLVVAISHSRRRPNYWMGRH